MKTIICDKHDRLLITKNYGLKFNTKFKYCENSELYDNDIDLQRRMLEKSYKLKYFDGCFKPFLVKVKP